MSTEEETIRAVARPQDRVVGGVEICCEICAEATQASEQVPQLGRMRASEVVRRVVGWNGSPFASRYV